jgi:hypothetical protein
MPIFDLPPRRGSLRPIGPQMTAWGEALLERFRSAFPELAFEIAWHSDTVNARALFGQPRHRIVLYGGLVRHRLIGDDGLALALAHEVGHLLGGRPRHRYHFWLSCEGVADYWATRHGVRKIWPAGEVMQRTRTGARQLLALQTRGLARARSQRRRREPDGRFACLQTLPPGCRWTTWMAGLARKARPACAC